MLGVLPGLVSVPSELSPASSQHWRFAVKEKRLFLLLTSGLLPQLAPEDHSRFPLVSQSSQQNTPSHPLVPNTSTQQRSCLGSLHDAGSCAGAGCQPHLSLPGARSNHEGPWHSREGLDIPWSPVWACRQESGPALLAGFATRGSLWEEAAKFPFE